MHKQPRVLLFDLGGVLIELVGQPIRNEWIAGHDTPEVSWQKWLTSDAARAFETGRISADDFARQIVAEMNLTISEAQFKQYFTDWPVGLYPGVLNLLRQLENDFELALFSNSNELHWGRKMHEMQLDGCFGHYFASHKIGLAKPDAAAFRYVIEHLPADPDTILFLDDNQMNIDAARAQGMQAERTCGFNEVKAVLAARGISYDL